MACVSLHNIDEVTIEVLTAVGVDKTSISIISDTIHYANRRGVPTHGVGRLPLYVKKIEAGHLNPKAVPEIVSDFGAMAVLDAQNGFGQVAAHKAVRVAIEKAQQFGIAAVGVRNSNNFGTAGYFGTMATKAGMAAIIFSNAAPAIAPTGGNKPIFGTNPLCYAFPGGKNAEPVVLDMATTIVARGKIRLAAKNGEKIPIGWALDSEGNPTDDPCRALNGTLLPIAGYKGYGLSAFVDLFAGVLTESASMGNVKPLSETGNDSRNGHMFIMIDVKRFLDEEKLSENMVEFYKAVKACGDEGKVMLPGEHGNIQMKSNINTVILPEKQIQEINKLAEHLGITIRLETGMKNNEKPVAIILGGTIPHKYMIKQLKKRGYFTVLVDYLENPPAKSAADIHVQESTLDQQAVLKIAREYSAELVICGCVDQANITACYVMEQIGKKPPYSYKTALQITNKGEMKRIMMENGIPTSKYLYIDKEEQINFDCFSLRYPVMVKPADSNSANGVRKAYHKKEAEQYLEDAIRVSRNGRAIVEEFLDGQEISAYCYIQDRKAKLLMTAERISTLDGAAEIIKCFSSIAPARISEAVERQAEQIATQIAAAFHLDNTPLFFQGIVKDGQIDVIEFAPRIGGGSCFKTIKENTGVDVISAIIDSWEGKKADISNWKKAEQLLVVNTVYGKDGIFDHLEGVDRILDSGDAIACYQIRSKGDRVDNSRASSSRIAFLIVKALDEKDLLRKVHRIYEKLKVFDEKGENIIRYDINIESMWDDIKIV